MEDVHQPVISDWKVVFDRSVAADMSVTASSVVHRPGLPSAIVLPLESDIQAADNTFIHLDYIIRHVPSYVLTAL